MPKIAFDATYYAGALATIDLPVEWSEVKDWYVKWDTFHYTTGGDWCEIELNSEFLGAIDTKRPKTVTVYATDEDGEPDWDTELAER